MIVGEFGNTSSSRGSCKEADLHKVGLVNVLNRNRLLADCSGKSIKTNGTACIVFYDSFKKSAVNVIKTELINFKSL